MQKLFILLLAIIASVNSFADVTLSIKDKASTVQAEIYCVNMLASERSMENMIEQAMSHASIKDINMDERGNIFILFNDYSPNNKSIYNSKIIIPSSFQCMMKKTTKSDS